MLVERLRPGGASSLYPNVGYSSVVFSVVDSVESVYLLQVL